MDATNDIDEVLICPYDKNHKIARSRIQRHLVKCEKNFPPNYKVLCPYDATHRIFEDELIEHVTNCPRRGVCSNVHIESKLTKMPDFDITNESLRLPNDETWDNDNEEEEEESNFGSEFNYRNATNTGSKRGNLASSKRYDVKLRVPFGYSEAQMLDIDSSVLSEDMESVTSFQGIGRGRTMFEAASLQQQIGRFARGTRGIPRRGARGRNFHQ